jgi:hypothetical protein
MNQATENKILQDELLRRVHNRTPAILAKSITAGERYPEL